MTTRTRLGIFFGGLLITITTSASVAEGKPSLGSDHDAGGKHRYLLRRLVEPPTDVSVAKASWVDDDDRRRIDPTSERTAIKLGTKKLFMELVGDGGDRRLRVSDTRDDLYDIDDDAPRFAYGWDGFHVFFAGNRNRAFAYDLTSGKKLASIQDLVFSPGGGFALSTPPFEQTGCANRSRTFRIPLDGSGKPYAIDTDPLQKEVLCTEDGALPRGNFHEIAAIAPDGKTYAVLARHELALFSAKNDALLAVYDEPPYDERDGAKNELTFSSSSKHLVVGRRGEDNALARTWFTWSKPRRVSRR